MNKRLGQHFGQTSQPVQRVGRGQVAGFLFAFKRLEGRFGFASSQDFVGAFPFGHPSNDASTTHQTVANRGFSTTDVGRNRSVGKGLQFAFHQRDGFVDGFSLRQFKHGASP